MITKGNKQKRQSQMTLPFLSSNCIEIYFLLENFFLRYPVSPRSLEPKRSMVVGLGQADLNGPTSCSEGLPIYFSHSVATAIHSTSTLALNARPEVPKALRAGKLPTVK